jgi:hypothetical protein
MELQGILPLRVLDRLIAIFSQLAGGMFHAPGRAWETSMSTEILPERSVGYTSSGLPHQLSVVTCAWQNACVPAPSTWFLPAFFILFPSTIMPLLLHPAQSMSIGTIPMSLGEVSWSSAYSFASELFCVCIAPVGRNIILIVGGWLGWLNPAECKHVPTDCLSACVSIR